MPAASDYNPVLRFMDQPRLSASRLTMHPERYEAWHAWMNSSASAMRAVAARMRHGAAGAHVGAPFVPSCAHN